MRAHLDIARDDHAVPADGGAQRAAAARIRWRCWRCDVVADDWHARFSCLARHYEYRIVTRRAPLTWENGAGVARARRTRRATRWHEAAQCWWGGTTSPLSARRIASPTARSGRSTGSTCRATATGSLCSPRRGRSCTIRCGRWSGAWRWSARENGRERDLQRALEARDRTALGLNAPPDGLYLRAGGLSLAAEPRGELDMRRPAELAYRLDPVEPISAFAQNLRIAREAYWDCTKHRRSTGAVRRGDARRPARARRRGADRGRRVEIGEIARPSPGGGTGRDDRRRPCRPAAPAAALSDRIGVARGFGGVDLGLGESDRRRCRARRTDRRPPSPCRRSPREPPRPAPPRPRAWPGGSCPCGNGTGTPLERHGDRLGLPARVSGPKPSSIDRRASVMALRRRRSALRPLPSPSASSPSIRTSTP